MKELMKEGRNERIKNDFITREFWEPEGSLVHYCLINRRVAVVLLSETLIK